MMHSILQSGCAALFASSASPRRIRRGRCRTPTRSNSRTTHVKVVRVHYDAGAKLPEHTHPAGTTAYVYLNDSEGVIFSHVGGSNRSVTRPAVKAGAIRIAAGPEEHHTAENPASTPSDFLRIMFKTEDAGVKNLRQRVPRPRSSGRTSR